MVFKPGQFKINGRTSQEFKAYMRSRPERISSGRVIELRERAANDSVVVDYNYYKNVEWSIKCGAKANSFEELVFLEDEIKFWLDMNNYSDFEFQFDEQYIYQAIVVEPPRFTSTHKDGLWTHFDFKISIRPFKENRLGLVWLNNVKKIFNMENYPSKPKIRIVGSGDISFWINDQKYELVNVGNEIIIDSRLEESYRVVDGVLEVQDHKTKFLDFPILPSGENNYRWSGKVTSFEILPRWCTKV